MKSHVRIAYFDSFQSSVFFYVITSISGFFTKTKLLVCSFWAYRQQFVKKTSKKISDSYIHDLEIIIKSSFCQTSLYMLTLWVDRFRPPLPKFFCWFWASYLLFTSTFKTYFLTARQICWYLKMTLTYFFTKIVYCFSSIRNLIIATEHFQQFISKRAITFS